MKNPLLKLGDWIAVIIAVIATALLAFSLFGCATHQTVGGWVVYDTLERDYLSTDLSWWDLEHAKRMTRGDAWVTLVKIRQGGTTEYYDTGPANYPIVIKYVGD